MFPGRIPHVVVVLAATILSLAVMAIAAEDPPSAVGPLMKLYRSGKLPPARQPAVVEMICARGNEHDLAVVMEKVLEPKAMTPEVRLKAMAGLTDAATTRKVKPIGNFDGVAELIGSPDAAVRSAAVRLSAALQVAGARPALQKIALDEKANADLKRTAIAGLVSLGGDESRQTLLELVEKASSPAIRIQAAAGLVGFEMKLAAQQGANVLAGISPQDDSGPLLDAFFSRKEGSEALAAAIEARPPSVDVAKRALRTMYSVGRSDAALSAVLSKAAGIAADAPPPTPEEVAKLVAEVPVKGDPARGERIFRRSDLSCMRCHSVSRAGGQVGPELSAVGGSSPLDYIANSILNPNLAVKEQYVTRVFETSDGEVLSGVLIDRDETRVRIRDAQGKIIIIPTADIEDETEGKSMMPQGITKFLTRDELLDLVRFVSELGKPGDYAVQSAPRIQRWQLMANPPAELTAAVPHLEHIRQFVAGSSPEAWSSVYATVSGALPLEELRSLSGGREAPDATHNQGADAPRSEIAKVVVLRGEFDVKNGGLVAFDIDCTENCQAWIDAQPAPAKSEFEVGLEPGRHSLVLRIEISERPNPELRVQVSHPPGSTARVEIINGT